MDTENKTAGLAAKCGSSAFVQMSWQTFFFYKIRIKLRQTPCIFRVHSKCSNLSCSKLPKLKNLRLYANWKLASKSRNLTPKCSTNNGKLPRMHEKQTTEAKMQHAQVNSTGQILPPEWAQKIRTVHLGSDSFCGKTKFGNKFLCFAVSEFVCVSENTVFTCIAKVNETKPRSKLQGVLTCFVCNKWIMYQ